MLTLPTSAHFADEATGFDSACSGSSGTENSRGGSVERERGGPKRKRATTPRAIPIAARRANWTIRLFLSMPRFCLKGHLGNSGESCLPNPQRLGTNVSGLAAPRKADFVESTGARGLSCSLTAVCICSVSSELSLSRKLCGVRKRPLK